MAPRRTYEVADAQARVVAVVARHERTLLRVARQASLCHDDALDAYQRALEIFVRRVASVDPATEVAWLKVVIRHEAMAIRRARSDLVASEDMDLDALVPASERSVEDQIAATERVRRSADALRSLKDDEANALLMKAHGLSYEEIGTRKGWTYTKVNRSITEGRRRFLRAYGELEAGQGCQRFAAAVEALAVGQATSAQIVDIRPHLRHCAACRATVRDLRKSRLQQTSIFAPLVGIAHTLRQRFVSAWERVGGDGGAGNADPLTSSSALSHADTQIRLLLSDTLADEGGTPVGRLAGVKHGLSALFHRASASDVAAGLHVVSTGGGGGRLATAATLLGVCLSSASVGTVCAVSGLWQHPNRSDRSLQRERDASRRDPDGKQSASASIAKIRGRYTKAASSARLGGASSPYASSSRSATTKMATKQTTSVKTAAEDEFGFEHAAARTPTRSDTAKTRPPARAATLAPPPAGSSSGTTDTAGDPAQLEFGP